MTNEYDAIIIGAGNGGMSTACGLAKGGMRPLLLERHNVPGGYATSFRRGEYEFEGSLHHLCGCGTKDHPGPLYSIFEDMGILDQVEYLELPHVMRFIIPGKCDVVIPAGRKNAVTALKKAFPEESDGIEAYYNMAWKCWEEFQAIFHFNFDLVDIYSKFDMEASPEKYPVFFQNAFQKATDILSSYFKSPWLQMAVGMIGCYSGPLPQIDFIDMLVWQYYYIEYQPLHVKNCSQEQSSAIMDRFIADGGEVHYNSNVKKIIVKDGAVKGVVTEDGSEFYANTIVSNLSPIVTYGELMEPTPASTQALQNFKGIELGRGTAIIFLALDCPCSQLGIDDTNIWMLDPVDSGFMTITTRDPIDPRSDGKSQLDLLSFVSSDDWLTTPPAQYYKKKYDLADKMLQQVERVFPGLREHIEEIEISTPLTNVRFSGQPGGAIGGIKSYFRRYLLFPENHHNIIEGLYLAGTGVSAPGGYQPMLSYGWTLGQTIAKGATVKK